MGSGSSSVRNSGEFSWKTTSEDISRAFGKSVAGKTAIVTGATSTTGLEITRILVKNGCEVFAPCLSMDRAHDALKIILKEFPSAKITYIYCDLSSLESVWNFCSKVRRKKQLLHLIINNAGTDISHRSLTVDGLDVQLAVNYLGHFFLTLQLLDLMISSSSHAMPGRIINVSCFTNYLLAPAEGIPLEDLTIKGTGDATGSKSSSSTKTHKYDRYERHGSSKLAGILFTRELARRAKERKLPIISVSVHPGLIEGTNTARTLTSLYTMAGALRRRRGALSKVLHEPRKTAQQGAATTLYCALAGGIQSGAHYSDCTEDTECLHPAANDDVKRLALWKKSLEITGVKDAYGGEY